jgi:hypothetical protein
VVKFDSIIIQAAEALIELRRAHPDLNRWDLFQSERSEPEFETYRLAREAALSFYGLEPMEIAGRSTHGPLRDQSVVDRDIALCAFELLIQEGR